MSRLSGVWRMDSRCNKNHYHTEYATLSTFSIRGEIVKYVRFRLSQEINRGEKLNSVKYIDLSTNLYVVANY